MDWRQQALDDARARLEAAGVPGATLALLVDGEEALAAGIGFRNVERSEPLLAGARFYIYSITKTLLATIALRLVEQGALDLDAPVAPLLTLPSPIDERITLRHLLTHTAGLPDYGSLPEYAAAVRADPSQPWSATEFLERTLARGPLFAPGEGWQYSNIGYLLVKTLVEQAGGGALRALVAEHIAGPLGLRDTFVAETLDDAATLTPGWSAWLANGGPATDAAPVYHPGWVSHGVVVSTALETARALDALAAGRLLRPESLEAMLTPRTLPFEHPQFRVPAYGLGVMIDAGALEGLVFGHGGGGPGYALVALCFTRHSGRRATSVAFTNHDGADIAMELAFALAEAAGDELSRAPKGMRH